MKGEQSSDSAALSAGGSAAGAAPRAPRLKVHEIFCSLQGESTHVGRRCVLIRLTGCQMRCSWCDTPYAFYDGQWMSLDEVLEVVEEFGCRLVEVTGGEPLLQPTALPLMAALADAGHEVLLETGGGLDISGVDPRVQRIVDIKCPASGEHENNHWPNLERLTERDELKFVIADEKDYQWARDLVAERRLTEICPVHFSPVQGTLQPVELADWILHDRLEVRMQLQLHKILWGAEATGV